MSDKAGRMVGVAIDDASAWGEEKTVLGRRYGVLFADFHDLCKIVHSFMVLASHFSMT